MFLWPYSNICESLEELETNAALETRFRSRYLKYIFQHSLFALTCKTFRNQVTYIRDFIVLLSYGIPSETSVLKGKSKTKKL